MKRFITILLLMGLTGCLVQAYAEKEPEMKRVYIFGFAASFTDSTACQTVVQTLDSAWLDGHKFLVDRSLYGLQLQNHMEDARQTRNSICTIFFDTNPKRLQRQWRKVHKLYEKSPGLHFLVLDEEQFRFKAEEYKPIIIEDMPAEATPAAPAEKDRPAGAPMAPPPAKR
ncbi:MAG: hypothetical protein K6C30_00890 [Bacteroidaceae bacterium]|nr:hypothetical protein [Bacteroidaceae bacterium]